MRKVLTTNFINDWRGLVRDLGTLVASELTLSGPSLVGQTLDSNYGLHRGREGETDISHTNVYDDRRKNTSTLFGGTFSFPMVLLLTYFSWHVGRGTRLTRFRVWEITSQDKHNPKLWNTTTKDVGELIEEWSINQFRFDSRSRFFFSGTDLRMSWSWN